ncbi:hypothetical protein [Mediterraneibacter sp.]|uniref:hypothetical protein n=1 Tax=Mediterraneibacter sp. TaxID=2316022 RepID=UPI0015AC61B1|nr:hypothetical protein [Mediterraneibacter sp.]
MAASQSPGLPENLTTAYNPGMCLLALPVITKEMKGECGKWNGRDCFQTEESVKAGLAQRWEI